MTGFVLCEIHTCSRRASDIMKSQVGGGEEYGQRLVKLRCMMWICPKGIRDIL